MESQKKIKEVCMQISFIMEHQEIVPELKEVVEKIAANDTYSMGAKDALTYLLMFLEQKGC